MVETLVALAITALALVALLQLFGAAGESTLRGKNRTLAELHMASLIAQTDVLITESTRDLTGEFSSQYHWRVRSLPMNSEVAAKSNLVVRQVTYTVRWREGRRERELSLTSERILQR